MDRFFNLPVEKIFRALIILELVFMALYVVAGIQGDHSLPDALRQYEDGRDKVYEKKPMLAAGILLISTGGLALTFLASIGLWRWKRFGLIFFLLGFLFYPLPFALGIDITVPTENLFDNIAVTITGLMLGLLFHPDIKRRFGIAAQA